MSEFPFTLRQLAVFERLCATHSFRLASEELGISQASVSNQIKALEEQLGLRLFVRDPGKEPYLTTEGRAFLSDLGPFQASGAQLASHRRNTLLADVAEPERLRIFVSQYIFNNQIRGRLPEFLERHPELELTIDANFFDADPRTQLSKGTFDFLVCHEARDRDLPPGWRKIGFVRHGVFGHRKWLDEHGAPPVAKELSKLPFVLPPQGSHFEKVTLANLAHHGIRPTNVATRAQYFDIMNSILERGSAVGVTIEGYLTAEQREIVVLLRSLGDLRATLYRDPQCDCVLADEFEQFLVDVMLEDPAYTPEPHPDG